MCGFGTATEDGAAGTLSAELAALCVGAGAATEAAGTSRVIVVDVEPREPQLTASKTMGTAAAGVASSSRPIGLAERRTFRLFTRATATRAR